MVITFARVKLACFKVRDFCQFAKNTTIKTRENEFKSAKLFSISLTWNLVRTLLFLGDSIFSNTISR